MKNTIFSLSAVLFLALIGCTKNQQNQATADLGNMQFAARIYQKSTEACSINPHGPCVSVNMEYPALVFGNEKIRKRINGTLQDFVVKELVKAHPEQAEDRSDLEGMAKDIYTAFEEKAKQKQVPAEFSILGKVLFRDAQRITIQMSAYQEFAKEQIAASRCLITFDAQTGEEITRTTLDRPQTTASR